MQSILLSTGASCPFTQITSTLFLIYICFEVIYLVKIKQFYLKYCLKNLKSTQKAAMQCMKTIISARWVENL